MNFSHVLTGAFGDPIEENPSGMMMEAGYRSIGLDWRYELLRVRREDFCQALKATRTLGFKGLNLTIPHKTHAIEYMDELTPAAELIGAINVIAFTSRGLLGENTDGKGFVKSLAEKGITLPGKTLVMLGAGGAARAIGVESALAGAKKLTVINRTPERGCELAEQIDRHTDCRTDYIAWEKHQKIPHADILINATNIGLYPDDTYPDIDYSCLTSDMIVQDIVPNPPHTAFLQKAADHGAQTLDGLGMLVHQGALAIRLWSGCEPDTQAMRRTLTEIFRLNHENGAIKVVN